MVKEFKDELKSLKNIFNEIKKLELLREQEINEIKNEMKRKLIWWSKRYIRKGRCRFNNFDNKM